MTTDVKVLIAEFLRTHKRLVVPQLGAFIVKAPGGEILFSELFKRDDGVLRGLLTAAGRQRDRSGGRHRPADFRSAPRRAARRRVSRRGAGVFLRRRQRDADVRLRSAGRCRGGACIALPAGSLWRRKHPANPLRTGPLHPARRIVGSDAVGRGRTPRYEPGSLREGSDLRRPVKTTDAIPSSAASRARRIDAFLIVAIVAALLAVGVIVYGYVNDRRAKQMQAELMEEVSQSAAADEAAAESVAE